MLLFDSTTEDAPPFALFEEWVDSVLRRAPLSFRYYQKALRRCYFTVIVKYAALQDDGIVTGENSNRASN